VDKSVCRTDRAGRVCDQDADGHDGYQVDACTEKKRMRSHPTFRIQRHGQFRLQPRLWPAHARTALAAPTWASRKDRKQTHSGPKSSPRRPGARHGRDRVCYRNRRGRTTALTRRPERATISSIRCGNNHHIQPHIPALVIVHKSYIYELRSSPSGRFCCLQASADAPRILDFIDLAKKLVTTQPHHHLMRRVDRSSKNFS
jgi:hypothetical protein